jgi:hypothetical protein
VIFGVQKYLYGRKFILYVDAKPLTLIFGPKKGIPVMAAARIQRWAIQLSTYLLNQIVQGWNAQENVKQTGTDSVDGMRKPLPP